MTFCFEKNKDWEYIRHKWSANLENMYGYPNQVFGGILANLLEIYFWYKYRNPLVIPTWFSFFGFWGNQF